MAFNMLCWLVAILTVVILVNFLNEKVLKIPVEITLLLSGVFLGGLMLFLDNYCHLFTVPIRVNDFFLDDYLMNGVLCFMLFAGASRLRFHFLATQLYLVLALSLVTTVLTTFFYGFIFYGCLTLFGLYVSFFDCLLLGAIIGPTDPIAAMSILRKVGLPEDVALAIEGESLFNDGVGVAIFVVVSGMVTGNASGGFFSIMTREVIGAGIIGLICCALTYFFFIKTENCYSRVCTSIVAVGSAYIFSTLFECSGAIASVVVGIFYASMVGAREDESFHEYYVFRTFWDAMNIVLNNMLYVMIGLCIVNMHTFAAMGIIVVTSLVVNLLARYAGVLFVAVGFKGKLPNEYKVIPFTNLLTWAGLKGGLCVALAMSTHKILSPYIFNIVMVCTMAIVLFTTCIQGITIGKLYLSQKE